MMCCFWIFILKFIASSSYRHQWKWDYFIIYIHMERECCCDIWHNMNEFWIVLHKTNDICIFNCSPMVFPLHQLNGSINWFNANQLFNLMYTHKSPHKPSRFHHHWCSIQIRVKLAENLSWPFDMKKGIHRESSHSHIFAIYHKKTFSMSNVRCPGTARNTKISGKEYMSEWVTDCKSNWIGEC